MVSRALWSVVVVFGVVSIANGMIYSGDIEYSAGGGANRAIVAVDFDASMSFLFEYRWDGQASGWDALEAIDMAGALDVSATDYGPWGMFVNDISYPGGVKYDYGSGVNTGWAYYTSADNLEWQLSGTGVSFRVLADGAWESWVWTNYPADWSAPVRPPGEQPIPEPVSILLMGIAGLLLRRHKPKESLLGWSG
jgi:hypothetical protein